MKLKSEQEIKFLEFMKIYKNNYPENVYSFLMDYYDSDKLSNYDIFRQVYSYLGFLDEDNDMYKGFLRVITDNFDINTDVLEVAGGFFPVLSKYINDIQIKTNKGTITVYDPELIVNSLNGVILKKEEFNSSTSIDKYKLVCGFYPCEVTETLIKKVCLEQKNFVIGLCGCVHFDNVFLGMYSNPLEMWENHIYNLVDKSKSNNCKVDVKYLEKKYDSEYPIIIGKHKE